CKLPTARGKTLGEMLEAARKGELKALFVVGENLLRAWPNTPAVEEALSKLEFLVVQDLFAHETAQKADVVLPAAAFAEKDGTFTSTDRRVQRVRKAVEPPEHARADWVILLDLLEAFDVKEKAKKPEDVFEEMTALMPIYQGLDWDEIGHTPGGMQWQASVPENPTLLVPQIRESEEKPDETLPLLAFVGRPPFHWNTGTLVERAHTLIREYPVSEVLINPADARERQLRSGMPVRVHTRKGSIQRTLRVSKEVPAGTIFLPIHFRDGLTVSVLNDALEPESKVPAMRVVAANLEKLG
ncbi:MAG: molybdopterin-dependent oxidoreductase, partial [Calditrichaeota bacterium]|nr:molybdopterin-dependent oxidoreductase [Calditrichota bacterium]